MTSWTAPAVQRPAGAGLAVLVLVTLSLFFYQRQLWISKGSKLLHPRLRAGQVQHVAFFTVGIGPAYFKLAQRQIAATQRHFCVDKPYSVHNFVFTDQFTDAGTGVSANSSVTLIYKQSQGWPRDSDDRYTWLGEAVRQHSMLERFDFALWMDSDNVLIEDTCEDMLGNLVALRHGWSFSAEAEFPYEGNNKSQAYVPQSNRFQHPYYSAHIFGGTVESLLHLADTCSQWTLVDRAAGIKAAVDDESYLQRYFKENCPTVTLSYAYVHPEGHVRPWSGTVKPMALAVEKEYAAYRDVGKGRRRWLLS